MSVIKRRVLLAVVLWLVLGLYIDLNPFPGYTATTVVVTILLFAAATAVTASIIALASEGAS